jgi:hypothetical protein
MAEGHTPRLETNEVFITLSSRIAAEALLGKVRFPGQTAEPRFLQPLRMLLLMYKRTLGAENYDKFVVEMKPALHVLGDALFDELTGVRQSKTTEAIAKLPIPLRVGVEQIVAHATGKHERGHGRWEGGLWEFKSMIDSVVNTSVSGITPRDIREGYDTFMHEVIEQIYEQRDALVN